LSVTPLLLAYQPKRCRAEAPHLAFVTYGVRPKA
jgi:hypothetical protein